MNLMKKCSALLLVLVLLVALAPATLAADSVVTYHGQAEGFGFAPGSLYTATDLFDGFKDVMPGDKLTETVEFRNEATDCDYIKVYLRAWVHDETENPLSESVAETETLATMTDFLSQLTMRIYNGEELIYDASPDEAGAMVDNVLLGSLFTGESLSLTVELDVPMELGNEYAHRVGEVDWIFLVEGFDYEKLTVHKIWEDNGYPDRPQSVEVNLLKNGEVVETVTLKDENQWTWTWDKLDETAQWTVEEAVVPEGYEVSYETEDNTVWITNYMDYQPPVDPKPEPIDLTVVKVWEGDEDKLEDRPDSVMVSLYNGTTLVEKVVLSEKNNWTHTWEDLDSSGNWSVLESSIPAGYTPAYQADGNVVTITNTATLIETGQLSWPVPVLGGLGALLIIFGILSMRKKETKNA